MDIPSRTRRLALSAACTLALGCGAEPVAPSSPPEPAGTVLALDPIGDLYVVDVSTGAARQVAGLGGEPITWANAALTPDGQRASGTNFPRPPQPYELRVVNLSDDTWKVVRTLGSNVVIGSTRLSPDGRFLAVSGVGVTDPLTLPSGVATIDIETDEQEDVWERPADEEYLDLAELRWLPDQSGFITIATGPSSARIARLDLASGTLTYLTDPIGFAIIPTVDLSPDGRTIAYSREDGKIRFITMEGQPAPGFPATIDGILPAFSPDGRYLAYSRRGTQHPGGLDGIWIHRFSDGAEWRLLPEESTVTWTLDWE